MCFDEVLKQLFVLHRAPFSQTLTANSSHASAVSLRQPFVDLQQLLAWITSEYHHRDASGRGDLSSALISFCRSPLFAPALHMRDNQSRFCLHRRYLRAHRRCREHPDDPGNAAMTNTEPPSMLTGLCVCLAGSEVAPWC